MRADLSRLLQPARAAGRATLLETEGLAVLAELSIAVPAHVVVADAAAATRVDLDEFRGHRVVVKVLSEDIVHKSDVGGVAVVDKKPAAVADAVARMQERLPGDQVVGYSVSEFVEHDAGLGGELLVGVRNTDDFGPVVTFGAGGVYTEFLAESFRPGRGVAILSPVLASEAAIDRALAEVAVTPLVTGALRNQRARATAGDLRDLIGRLLEFAADYVPHEIVELEVNPIVPTERGFVALDALVRLGGGESRAAPERPLHKLQNLLQPRSIALIGVSEKMNPGRIMLRNILREGFPAGRVYVVKPGAEQIDGCACHDDVASLPEAVDLFVVSVAAPMVPDVVRQVVEHEKAESVILIPGGLGEREDSRQHAEEVQETLRESRSTEWRGPIINGANCLGVRSRPGHYDTLFIPQHKLPFPGGEPSPLALISQSGAFAVARSSKLWSLEPKYVVTVGNQIDLTVGDYLTFLKDDPAIEVFACYVEGFRPQDGRRWLEAAAEITASGRMVVMYRAGRTAAGAQASASHTASLAGEYAVTRQLAGAAGVLVAETLADFEDLVRLCTLLRGKRVAGLRLGAVSNAGFECVAIADNLAEFTLASFADETATRLAGILDGVRLGTIVGVQNPFDLTPIAGDEPFAAAAQAVLGDPNVDVGVIGCVPLTGAMNTLAAGAGHREDVLADDSFARRLEQLNGESAKAWIAVVDGGPLYHAMAQLLERQGVPTFRTADRALRLFSRYCCQRLGG